MIWFAINVSRSAEVLGERILRGYFRETRRNVELMVPLRHVVRQEASRMAKRAVRSVCVLPGTILIGVNSFEELPVAELERFKFVHGFLRGPDGVPKRLSEVDMIRILGDLHQRGENYRPGRGRKRKKAGAWLEILDGPYAMRTARVVVDRGEYCGPVSSMVLTGTTEEFDDLTFDNGDNGRYMSELDAPLAVAGRVDPSSEGDPVETRPRQHRAQFAA